MFFHRKNEIYNGKIVNMLHLIYNLKFTIDVLASYIIAEKDIKNATTHELLPNGPQTMMRVFSIRFESDDAAAILIIIYNMDGDVYKITSIVIGFDEKVHPYACIYQNGVKSKFMIEESKHWAGFTIGIEYAYTLYACNQQSQLYRIIGTSHTFEHFMKCIPRIIADFCSFARELLKTVSV